MSYDYLGSPYSHPDPAVMEYRYRAAVKKAADLMLAGHVVFSPIAHTHEIGKLIGKPVDHDFWMVQDMPMLEHAKRLLVLKLDGWLDSRGLNDEIRRSVEMGKPIEYLDP